MLPEELKQRVETAIAVHDFPWPRDQIRPGFFTEQERAEYPPVRHPLVRTNPVNGRKALFLGAHASHIVDMPVEDGCALLKELLEHVTQPEFCYRHEWQEGDLVIWDNRCVLHRATPFDTTRHKRFMQRTTVAGDPAEFARAGRLDRWRRVSRSAGLGVATEPEYQPRLSRGKSRDAASSTWASWSPPAKRREMWRAPASIQRWSHSTQPSIGPA